ncbi:MltA-interacting protein MipA [Rhodobacteraceae bacterium THAF1]|uniref:MipA/OmpV family protein n=1 Tax=Palleronia sp. THAF1 TaxID=2587842 RepID=UPI000F3B2C4A|nr:MipA/OmpV family protein [Palleronia sp. THAF1]QFU07435.1 MltA-interacting protein MipA [Palleronia sp. THAF1]VDC20653.1 MltA-interacting protein MipA [Rhodobacteraceae bacterium THAF1]
MANRLFLASAACAAAFAGAAQAGDMTVAPSEPMVMAPAPMPVAPTPNLVFTLAGGVTSTPEYFGSDSYTVGPSLGFALNYVNLGALQFGSPDPYYQPEGFGLRGSFRYIDERDASDNPELAGTIDVDATYELGLGLGYQSRNFDAFADVRYGFGGHEEFVGEIGADVKARPIDRLTLSAGPRVLFGTDDYAATYFSTPATFAGGAYDADGGVISAGIELGANYRLSENWGIEGTVSYDRFVGDAADSPIVEQGDRDQYGITVGLIRRITLDF